MKNSSTPDLTASHIFVTSPVDSVRRVLVNGGWLWDLSIADHIRRQLAETRPDITWGYYGEVETNAGDDGTLLAMATIYGHDSSNDVYVLKVDGFKVGGSRDDVAESARVLSLFGLGRESKIVRELTQAPAVPQVLLFGNPR